MSKKIKLSSLIQDEKNNNKHTAYGMDLLEKSVNKVGIIESITVSNDDKIISGNARHEVIGKNFDKEAIVIETDGTQPIIIKRTDIESNTKQFYEASILANTTAKKNIDFDMEVIDNLVEEFDIDVVDLGVDIVDYSDGENEITSEIEDKIAEAHAKLTDKFIVPPFTILDTRQGYWQERKRYWKELIGDNGESRTDTLFKSKGDPVSDKIREQGTVSLLDPVLSELVNLWFGLPNSKTFDCFAGDSVFGYVSSYLGNSFTGIELRQEQADLNNKRIKGFNSKYICDDGRNVLKHIEKDSQDLLFSCPPYFDLEVYSDLENDASNQDSYEDFIKILDDAFTDSIKCLKNNRFAVITVGDVRDKQGFYYRFVDDIKDIFKRNNVLLYNELILVESIGTLPQRVGRFMEHRKIGKCHQNVLVFFKGDPKQIKNIFPIIKVNEESEINDNDITLATVLDMPELIEFRKPFIKDKFIMYLSAAIIQDAVDKQRLYLLKKDGEIKAYLWLNNMPRKEVCKIEEICSTVTGGGTKFMQFAEQQSKFKTMYLEVVDYNENAINFYINKGYSITDKKVGEKITNLVMTKQIDNESTDV